MTQAKRLPDTRLPLKRLSEREFIILIALNFAMVAASIDAMLPGLSQIGAELSPGNINRAQLVLTSFVFGMGVGTLFAGPLSDSFGRKPVIAIGVAIYILGGVLAAHATSLETLVAARVLQGLGVAGPRIVAVAIVRDLYQGRQMAKILSYVFMVFTMVPALAPSFGALVIDAYGWRMVFYALIGFACLAVGGLMLRQPETLPRPKRAAFSVAHLWAATKICFAERSFVLSTICQTFGYAMLFAAISSTPQIFDITYGRGAHFPLWFGLVAVLGGAASIVNAKLVERFGMRVMILVGFCAQVLISGVILTVAMTLPLPFVLYFIWTVSIFFMVGLTVGNLNALAMEPLGQVAGLAASIIGFVATVASVGLAIPIGLAFDGTPLPLAVGVFTLAGLGALVMRFGMR